MCTCAGFPESRPSVSAGYILSNFPLPFLPRSLRPILGVVCMWLNSLAVIWVATGVIVFMEALVDFNRKK